MCYCQRVLKVLGARACYLLGFSGFSVLYAPGRDGPYTLGDVSPPDFLPRVYSLSDVMAWPNDFLTVIGTHFPRGAVEYLHTRLKCGTYSTAFSGVDAPGSVRGSGSCLRNR